MQSVHLMGDGYEPHVTQEEGKLTYLLPVDSGFISYEFAFEISRHDLDILLSDDYRRAVLEITAHTLLQRSTLKGYDRFTQKDFDKLVTNTLHSTPDFLQTFISQISHEHHIVIEHYVKEIMDRRSASQ
ncbi:hypothetical protein [Pantoea agglomerans]|uniref:hypothetical protein n=1 Tax=Enterobacter agglomerans TaxID=549 RepID=UPI0006DD41FB|nr:hypothetical protein [Pantoea agglomerans]KPA04490.1 hypothetical protein PAP10c_p3124 [Pantoea agglomerans]